MPCFSVKSKAKGTVMQRVNTTMSEMTNLNIHKHTVKLRSTYT